MKDRVAVFWFTSPITNILCCTSAETHHEITLQRRQNRAVRASMLVSTAYRGAASIIEATIADVREDGYDLQRDEVGNEVRTRAQLPYFEAFPDPNGLAIAPLVHDPDADLAQAEAPVDDLPPLLAPEDEHEPPGPDALVVFVPGALQVAGEEPEERAPAQPEPDAPVPVQGRADRRGVFFVPDFAASVVIEVRSRVGQLPANVPGNALVVEREALRLMRKYRVREVDAVAHLPSIIRNYFREDVHYRVSTSESRMTRFQRWLVGETQPPPAFTPLA